MSLPHRIEIGSRWLESQLATPNRPPLKDLSTALLDQNMSMVLSPGLPEHLLPAPILKLISWFDHYEVTIIPECPEQAALENFLVANYARFLQIAQRTEALPFAGMPEFKAHSLRRWAQILVYLKNLREEIGLSTR